MFFKIKKLRIFFLVALLSLLSPLNSFAKKDSNKTNDVVSEIERTLLFDKESRKKVNFYKNNKKTKAQDYNINHAPLSLYNAPYESDKIEIVVVDDKSQNFDLREKERLAYNTALSGQYEVAIELYKHVLSKEPDNNYAKFSLAVIYQKLGQLKQAKALYRDLLNKDIDNQDNIISNLLALLIEESPKDASYLLSRLTVQNSQSAYILAQAAIAYSKNGDYKKSAQLLQRAVAIDEKNLAYKYNLAIAYDHLSYHKEAISLYTDIIQNYSQEYNNLISVVGVQERLEILKKTI